MRHDKPAASANYVLIGLHRLVKENGSGSRVSELHALILDRAAAKRTYPNVVPFPGPGECAVSRCSTRTDVERGATSTIAEFPSPVVRAQRSHAQGE